MRGYTAEDVPATPGSTYQIAMYSADGYVPGTAEFIWQADSDEDAVGRAREIMADHPGWIGSLNRWYRPGDRLLGGVWIADIHDAGARVDAETDGFDAAVNGTAHR